MFVFTIQFNFACIKIRPLSAASSSQLASCLEDCKMDSSMEIVDGHMHLWTPTTHPWLNQVKSGGHPAGSFEKVLTYLVDDYKADISGYNVTQSVHVEAVWPGDPVNETKWLDGLAGSNTAGFPHAIVGHCDLSSTGVDDILKRHSVSKRMRGIRHMLNFHPDYPQYSEPKHDNYLTDKNWIEGFGLLQKYNMSFEMHILPGQMMRAADVIKQHPGVMVMVDHCGIPYVRDEPTMKQWREGLQEMARYPNVYCKASGMFATDPKWDQKSVNTVVKPLFDIYGFDRTIFASNFPVDKVNGTFPQLIDALRVILKPFSAEEQKKFFALNAKKFYRL